MEPSVHDNLLVSYMVDCQSRTITLHTIFKDKRPWKYTDVIFTGVVAHQFHHVLECNILFDVTEASSQEIATEHQTLFADSWRWGWPAIEYEGDLERLVAALIERKIKGYVVQSSFGCHGWVLAEKCERVSCDVVETTPTPG